MKPHIKLACVAALALAVGLGVGHSTAWARLAWADAPPAGRWVPCYATQTAAEIPAAFDAARAAYGVKIQEGDLPNTILVPRGSSAGQVVPPGCVAVEDRWGDVALWRDRQGGAGRWVAHPSYQQGKADDADGTP